MGNSIQDIQGCDGISRKGSYVNYNQDPHLSLQPSFPSYIMWINYELHPNWCISIFIRLMIQTGVENRTTQ
jgi:hypothetical protein